MYKSTSPSTAKCVSPDVWLHPGDSQQLDVVDVVGSGLSISSDMCMMYAMRMVPTVIVQPNVKSSIMVLLQQCGDDTLPRGRNGLLTGIN